MKRTVSIAFLLMAVSLLALAASPVFGGNDGDGLDKAEQARERHT
jgi:hypothetical protein